MQAGKWCMGCRLWRNPRDFVETASSADGLRHLCRYCYGSLSRQERWSYNVEYRTIRHNLIRANQLGLDSNWTPEEWYACKEYWNYQCAFCESRNKITIEHWIPLRANDSPGTVASNILPSCSTCNKSKHANDPQKWLTRHYHMNIAMGILDNISRYFIWIEKPRIWIATKHNNQWRGKPIVQTELELIW